MFFKETCYNCSFVLEVALKPYPYNSIFNITLAITFLKEDILSTFYTVFGHILRNFVRIVKDKKCFKKHYVVCIFSSSLLYFYFLSLTHKLTP